MSFSAEIKEELCRIRLKTPALQRAQLAGLTQTCASLRIGRTPQVLYQSESPAVIRHIAQLGTALYALEAVTFRREQEHRRQALSAVTFSGADCRRLLTDTGVLRESDGALSFEKRIPAAAESDPECRRAFLRGAFLGSGSCSNPAGGYHLEIVCRTDAFAAGLVELMEHSGIAARATTRKGRPLVYLKGEEVAAFLALTARTPPRSPSKTPARSATSATTSTARATAKPPTSARPSTPACSSCRPSPRSKRTWR